MEDNSKLFAEKNRYRSSFGATILFSSVQFYQILVRVIKSKFVALFIGPMGMGIQSLLHTTTDLISATTNLGLRTSGVRTIAEAKVDNEQDKISKTIIVLRRLILITGVLGMMICAFLAPIWSRTSFGNDEFVLAFVFISVIILLDQLNNGELALLQGLQFKRYLAKANVIGQSLTLLITIPLFYWYGVKAIVWVFVLSSFLTYCISRYFTFKLKLPKLNVSWKETITIGTDMIKLGSFLSLQFLMSQVVVYVVRNYVSNCGGIEEVGLYSAGTNIVTTYLGLVFTAIGTDYFPRLAATKNNEELSDTIHIQAEISILLFAPLIILFFTYSQPIIRILYSDKFLPIEYMMYWSVGATLFQAMGWALSYTLLAKAKPVYFFLNEFFAACYSTPLKIIGYSLGGLTGFGVATLVTYTLYLFQVLFVVNKMFRISYNPYIWKLFFILNVIVIIAITIKMCFSETWGYVLGTILIVTTTIAVYKQMDKRMDLSTYIRRKFKRNEGVV